MLDDMVEKFNGDPFVKENRVAIFEDFTRLMLEPNLIAPVCPRA